MEIFSLVLLVIIAILLISVLIVLWGMTSFLLRLAEVVQEIREQTTESIVPPVPARQVPLEIID
jgi:hypothetical protein